MVNAMRLYRYVGPRNIAERVRNAPSGTVVGSVSDILAWVRATHQHPDAAGCVIATFVIDPAGALRVADRHSEHLACAAGGLVQSAGEITWVLDGASVEVEAVSNQSTGFCPEPESWPAGEAALRSVGLTPPTGFNPACIFRCCEHCSSICLIKDDVFACALCEAELP